MLPLRLVFDTNEVVSAALKESGLQRAALTLALTKPARLYVSEEILAEYQGVLARPKFAISKGMQAQFMQLVRRKSHLVKTKYRLAVCSDPDDDIFLECADAARADYLVTGNKRHFPEYWKSTKVITAREFLDLVAPHLLH